VRHVHERLTGAYPDPKSGAYRIFFLVSPPPLRPRGGSIGRSGEPIGPAYPAFSIVKDITFFGCSITSIFDQIIVRVGRGGKLGTKSGRPTTIRCVATLPMHLGTVLSSQLPVYRDPLPDLASLCHGGLITEYLSRAMKYIERLKGFLLAVWAPPTGKRFARACPACQKCSKSARKVPPGLSFRLPV
jgi:hypothetical protein